MASHEPVQNRLRFTCFNRLRFSNSRQSLVLPQWWTWKKWFQWVLVILSTELFQTDPCLNQIIWNKIKLNQNFTKPLQKVWHEILHNSLRFFNGAWLTSAIKISQVTWFKSERCPFSRFPETCIAKVYLHIYLLNWLLSTKQLSILRFGGWCNKLLSPRKTMFWGIQPKFLWRKLSRPCGNDLLIGCCWIIGIIGVAWPNKIIRKIRPKSNYFGNTMVKKGWVAKFERNFLTKSGSRRHD